MIRLLLLVLFVWFLLAMIRIAIPVLQFLFWVTVYLGAFGFCLILLVVISTWLFSRRRED